MRYRLPITAHVPLIVMVFMLAVSLFTSERVLSRLSETQMRHTQALADVYLDGLILALLEGMVREDVWQVYDVLDRSQHSAGELRPVETIVAGAEGLVLASSDPGRTPSQSRVPETIMSATAEAGKIAISEQQQRAYMKREVRYENQPIGTVYAALDIASLLAERRQVLWTLVLTNGALTLLLAVAAWFTVGRMMRPVEVLTGYLERSHDGTVSPIPPEVASSIGKDYRRPYAAFNRLAAAVTEREHLAAQLAKEERLASLGRLASGMAHEINNPLGGLFNAIDTLKTHGNDPSTRARTLDIVERGLGGIRDVVRAALLSYRAERDERQLGGDDIEDLKLLLSPEARRQGVALHWRNALSSQVALPANTVRQIILNLVLNACQATPQDSWVAATIIETARTLEFEVEDTGPGMPTAAVEMLTSKSNKPAPISQSMGLGLWMTNRLIRELNGVSTVSKSIGGGTVVTVSLPKRHQMETSHVA